jgi:hypothetical protein
MLDEYRNIHSTWHTSCSLSCNSSSQVISTNFSLLEDNDIVFSLSYLGERISHICQTELHFKHSAFQFVTKAFSRDEK